MAWPLLKQLSHGPRLSLTHLHMARACGECGEWQTRKTVTFFRVLQCDEEWVQSPSPSPSQPQRRGRRGKLTCNMKMHFSLLIENFLRELSFIFFSAAAAASDSASSVPFSLVCCELALFRGLFLVSKHTHTHRCTVTHGIQYACRGTDIGGKVKVKCECRLSVCQFARLSLIWPWTFQ